MIELCPHCGQKLILPSGHKDAPYLFVMDAPDWKEAMTGIGYTGDAAVVLVSEMQKAGINTRSCRFATMWLHEPNKDQRCSQMGYDNLLLEMANKRGVVLMGAELCKLFCNAAVSEWSGLEVQPVVEIPNFAGWMMVMIDPGMAIHQSFGEVRLALQKAKRRMNG